MIDKINDEFIVDCTNNSKEERQQVYKFLVDNRNYEKSYLEDYFPVIVCNKKQDYSNWDSLEKYYNWVDSKKDIPIYTFEQFKEMYLENFILPEKWCIKITSENLSFCKSLKNKELGFREGYNYIIGGYYSSIASSEGNFGFIIIPNGYKEITFEQFKKYVLNQNNMENNKQIIGYKLIKEEYREAAYKIANVIWFVNDVVDFQENCYIEKKLEEAGVLDLWFEKVYEKEFKIGDWIIDPSASEPEASKIKSINRKYYKCEGDDPEILGFSKDKKNLRLATPEEIAKAQKTIVKMYSSNKGEFEIEVVNGKAYYRPENKELPKKWIKDIIDSFGEIIYSKGGIDFPYNVKISSINVGCYSNCKKEDWENVYKLLK